MAGTLQEGIRLFQLKRWEMALQEFLQISADPEQNENNELFYYLGLCYTKLERFEEALRYLEQVINTAQDPLRLYQCRMALAYIYVLTNRAQMAEFELTHLVNNGFESVQIYTTLAYAAWAQEQYERAVDLYEKALVLNDRNPTAINGLGYILADTDIDVRRGLELCRKAVDYDSRNAAYLDSLGWAYFKNDDMREALIWLHRALDLAPQQRDIQIHIRIVEREKK